ncbi:hypothetical protein TNCV_1827311 [Trichonephila clavipes]|nr:hypothetical protein TNCV_1827311 [Trichonephila clavipes]
MASTIARCHTIGLFPMRNSQGIVSRRCDFSNERNSSSAQCLYFGGYRAAATSSSCASASSSNAWELDEKGQAHPGIHKRRICFFAAWDVEGMVLDVVEVSKTGLVSANKGENIDPVDKEGALLDKNDET